MQIIPYQNLHQFFSFLSLQATDQIKTATSIPRPALLKDYYRELSTVRYMIKYFLEVLKHGGFLSSLLVHDDSSS